MPRMLGKFIGLTILIGSVGIASCQAFLAA